MIKRITSGLLLLIVFACTQSQIRETKEKSIVFSSNEYIFDHTRNRQIPIEIYALSVSSEWNGELIVLNAGYGSSNTEYSYITKALAKEGYYVVSIQHEVQSDEMIPSGDDIIQLRTPNWEEGIKNMECILPYVKDRNPEISTERIHLIGHSNGGDISVLFATENPERVASLITLDHRRMPIPLTKEYKTLSFRADQFKADSGVIPSNEDQEKFNIKIIDLKNVDHNYLRDIATKETKEHVITSIFDFINL